MFWDYICKLKHGRQNNIKKKKKRKRNHAQAGGDLQSRAKTWEKRFTVRLFNPMSRAKIQKHSKTTEQAKKGTWEDWWVDFEKNICRQIYVFITKAPTVSLWKTNQVLCSKAGKSLLWSMNSGLKAKKEKANSARPGVVVSLWRICDPVFIGTG